MKIHPDLALLAPVPTVFLGDGKDLCDRNAVLTNRRFAGD